MDKQERIYSAAIDVVYGTDDTDGFNGRRFSEYALCINWNDEYVEQILFWIKKGGYKVYSLKNGFITNKNRFVDAKEAMEIAIDQDQILEINNCFYELTKANANENFRKVKELLSKLQKLRIDYASRELKPEDLY